MSTTTRKPKDSKTKIQGLGVQIAIARDLKNLTQKGLALKLGVTRQTVTNWETGVSEPSLYQVKQIKEICGVTYDFLFEGSKISDFELYQQIKNLSSQEKQTIRKILELLS